MRGITQQQDLAINSPGPTFHRAQFANGVVKEVFYKSRHQRNCIGEFAIKEFEHASLLVHLNQSLLIEE